MKEKMEQQCAHDWSESLETCRTCEGIEIEEAEIEMDSSVGSSGLRMKTEPLYGYFCEECQDFTIVSLARHCILCDEVEWLNTMDEDIFEV